MTTLIPTYAGDPGIQAEAGLFIEAIRDDHRVGIETGGTGEVELAFDPVQAGYLWLIQRIAVITNSGTASEARFYAGPIANTNVKDATENGNLDVADMASPILVPGGKAFNVKWTGLSAGAEATITIQYALVRQGGA